MEMAENLLATLVEQRLKALDTNPFAFEKAHGFPEDSLRSILRGNKKKSGTAINRAQEICAALGIDFHIGLAPEPPHLPPVDEDDFALIKLTNARLAAGGGAENGDSHVTDLLAFRRDWLKRLRVDPSSAVLARVTGNSMLPTLADGDTILIDTSTTARQVAVRSRPPARGNTPIYALRTNEGERVKRLLRPDDGTFILLSDNPDEAPEIYSGKELRRLELKIIGQVVWSGHIWR